MELIGAEFCGGYGLFCAISVHRLGVLPGREYCSYAPSFMQSTDLGAQIFLSIAW